MLAALKQSTESRQLVELAKKYLQGVRGTLVQAKKLKAEKAVQRAALAQQIAGVSGSGGGGGGGPVTVTQNRQNVQKIAQAQHSSGPSAGVSEAIGYRLQELQRAMAQDRLYRDNIKESGAAGTWRDASKG